MGVYSEVNELIETTLNEAKSSGTLTAIKKIYNGPFVETIHDSENPSISIGNMVINEREANKSNNKIHLVPIQLTIVLRDLISSGTYTEHLELTEKVRDVIIIDYNSGIFAPEIESINSQQDNSYYVTTITFSFALSTSFVKNEANSTSI